MVRFQLWLTENPAATVTQKLDELRSIQTMSSLRPADRIIIFLGTIFTEKILTENQVLGIVISYRLWGVLIGVYMYVCALDCGEQGDVGCAGPHCDSAEAADRCL